VLFVPSSHTNEKWECTVCMVERYRVLKGDRSRCSAHLTARTLYISEVHDLTRIRCLAFVFSLDIVG